MSLTSFLRRAAGERLQAVIAREVAAIAAELHIAVTRLEIPLVDCTPIGGPPIYVVGKIDVDFVDTTR